MYKSPDGFLVPYIFEPEDVGMTLYWPVARHDGARRCNFAVNVRVIEIENARCAETDNDSTWEFIRIVDEKIIREVWWQDSDEPTIIEVDDEEQVQKLPPIIGQYLCIDEPIGHGFILGKDLFFTVEGCYKVLRKSAKGNKQKHFRQWRRDAKRFLINTFLEQGRQPPAELGRPPSPK